MTENTQVKTPTVDCLELVIPFLIFDSEDDFYFLQILQRKKENENQNQNRKSRNPKKSKIHIFSSFRVIFEWRLKK